MALPQREPFRRIPLPFAGDPWAQPGAQEVPPADLVAIRCDGSPLRITVAPYDGVDLDSARVDGDASTIDIVAVKAFTDPNGDVVLSRATTLVETQGQQIGLGRQFTEKDVSAQEHVYLGVVAVTQDTADALWLYLDAGGVAVEVE